MSRGATFTPHCDSFCQFNIVVESVKPVNVRTEGEVEGRTAWEVTSSDSSGHQKTETFDSVFVCSG